MLDGSPRGRMPRPMQSKAREAAMIGSRG